MPRTAFSDLPSAVLEAVRERTGAVLEESPTRFGARSALTSTLSTEGGPVFVKAAPTASPFIGGLRNEAGINPHVEHLAASLLWQVEAEDWLVLGFEHVEGRHAFYEPGSLALSTLTGMLHELADVPCPEIVTKPIAPKWAGDDLALASAMAGDALLHTDLNPANLLLAEGRSVLIDWAWASRGAAWVEIALLMPRLVSYGHTPEEAEKWAGQFGTWRSAPAEALDAFAVRSLLRWKRSERGDVGWLAEMVEATRRWKEYRIAG